MGSLSAETVREGGYTLIELLVVVAITGIVIVAAALAWPEPSTAALEVEAKRLADRIELALAQNQVAGRRIALSFNDRGYAFWERDAGGIWAQAPSSEEPRGAALSAGIVVDSVSVGGLRRGPGERMRLSMNDPVPIEIVLRSQSASAVVASSQFAGRMDAKLREARE